MLYKCDEGTVFGEIQAMNLSSDAVQVILESFIF